MEFGNFTRTTIMLVAMILSACQSMQHNQSELADSAIIGNLSINMLDMSYSFSKLNVTQAGCYQLNVSNASNVPHDIVFSNGIKLIVAPGKQASTILDIPALLPQKMASTPSLPMLLILSVRVR